MKDANHKRTTENRPSWTGRGLLLRVGQKNGEQTLMDTDIASGDSENVPQL